MTENHEITKLRWYIITHLIEKYYTLFNFANDAYIIFCPAFSNSTVKGRVSSWPEAFLQVTVDWTVTRSSSEEV